MHGTAFGTPVIHPTAYVHPSAVIIGNVTLEKDVSVWAGAVLRGDRDAIRIGEGTNVQDGVVIHCDPGVPCVVGPRVTIGHRAVVHACVVEEGALIGIGALVLSHAKVGAGALIAAGAVVGEHKVIPSGMLVAGVPARVLKELSDEQKERLSYSWRTYVELKERYKAD